MAVAAYPIHSDAIIPRSDLEESDRVTVRMIRQRFVVELMKNNMKFDSPVKAKSGNKEEVSS